MGRRATCSNCMVTRRQRSGVATAALSSLASYPLSIIRKGLTSEWFEDAIRDIVRHLSDVPFLQTVNFSASGRPQCSAFHVEGPVVHSPELWQSIAKHISAGTTPDAVILVQRLDVTQSRDDEYVADEKAEETCQRLLSSGIGKSILTDSVGDCCDDDEEEEDVISKSPSSTVVPFTHKISQSSKKRASVRAAALPESMTAGQTSAFWGVVVQSAQHTGAEGCYLLKTVRNVDPIGCSCTHFSLTKISERENVERQFVDSWLV